MLIVMDLDGTLLNEEGRLTDYTKKILKEVSKDNILRNSHENSRLLVSEMKTAKNEQNK